MASLSQIFKQLVGSGSYDPGASARAALSSSNSPMIKSLFSSQPIVPAKPGAAPVNMSYNTANGLPPSPTNPLLNTSTPVANTAPKVAPGPTASAGPVFSGSPTPGPTGSTGPVQVQIPPQWINPAGGFYTPDEIASNIAKSASAGNGPSAGNGDIPQYAGNLLTQGPQTAEQLQAAAAALNNARNDISTGASDPYNVASKSGIAYTPAELDAIEKAYAGVYDPAINTALAKLSDQQKTDAANNAPYTLGKDEIRYDGQGNPIAVGPSSTSTTGTANDYLPNGVYTPGVSPTVDSWAKSIANGTGKITDIPASSKGLRDAVQIALNTQGTNLTGGATTTSLGKQALASAKALLNQFVANGGEPAVGTSRLFGGGIALPVSQSADFKNAFTHLQSQLAVDASKLLQGQGQISDGERELLSQAASSLNLNTSESTFVKSLQGIIDKLSGGVDDSGATSADGTISTPDGKQWTQQPDGSYQEVSFNSVGNTTASGNIPQRNNNPGNVKSGGVADKYAVGTDKYGHLIFPDAQTGLLALQSDLSAKINGNSKYLPANPTISQLGSVYAEDPSWGSKVASLLGVPASTNTKSIPIAALAHAIATQEGYFA